MKKVFLILLLVIPILYQCKENNQKKNDTEPYYIRMADSEMQRNPESWMVDFMDKIKWNYTHGLEMQAFTKVY